MADVIDTMFGWMMEIFSWIIEKLVKLAVWLLKVAMAGIIALVSLVFRKKRSGSAGQEACPDEQHDNAG